MMMDWSAVCKRWHDHSVEFLKKNGVVPFMLRIYPMQTDDCAVWLEAEGLSDQSRAKLRFLSMEFKRSNPAAVLICSDTWMASTKFFEHYGIKELPIGSRKKRYWEILKKEFGGTLGNVPDQLKGEAIITGVKGPKFMPQTIITFYRREGKQIVTEESPDMKNMQGGMTLVPDWWESVIQ